MTKVEQGAASLIVVALAAIVYGTLPDDAVEVHRPDGPVPAPAVAPAPGPASTAPALVGSATADLRSRSDAPGSAAGRPAAPVQAETLGVHQSPSPPPLPPATAAWLPPSPGSQVSREVFAEDVLARRAAYGRTARAAPAEDAAGN
ncbi:hypothetical protein ABXN37_22000 [Piscinibacter sakaiensis]|uniref:hypothetical protein n=1 Tax=Piscinibacter sakaiensis TaxID=1547922 RepID=UPI0012F96944